MTHETSDPKIRKVPASTAEEILLGRTIVREHLGDLFTLVFDLPRNVGVKGDQGIWGETVLISTSDQSALVALHNDTDKLAEASTAITNQLPAVCRVLIDIVAQPEEAA